MDKSEVKVYCYEFSIVDDPYFPERDYVLVTNCPDDKAMENFTNYFYTHNGIISYCDDAFIAPQTTFNNIIKPILTKSLNEIVIENWEGGEI